MEVAEAEVNAAAEVDHEDSRKGWFHAFGRKLEKCRSEESGYGATFQPHRGHMGASELEALSGGGREG